MPRSAPFIVLLVLIAASAFALGSDTPAAALFFAGAVTGLSAALILLHRGAPGGLALAGLSAAALLWVIGLANGWVASGAGEYATLAGAFAVFAAAQIAARDHKTAQALWAATLTVGLIVSAVAFLDFITSPETMATFDRPYHRSRLSTPFLSANTAATFYGLIALVSLADLIRVVRRFEPKGRGAIEQLSRSAALPIAALLVSLTCVFLSASRAGATFLAAAILVLVSWEVFRGVSGGKRLNIRTAGLTIGAIGLGAMVFAVSGDLYADRFTATFGQADGRSVIFPAYVEALRMAPLLGNGIGGFVFINAFIADAENARTVMSQGAAHNVLLQWGLQGGLLGLSFILAIGRAWLLMLRRGLMRRNRQTAYMRAAVVATLFVAAHGMVDYALEIPAVLFLFAWVSGLGAGVATGGSRTLGPGGGPRVSRAITLTVAAMLLAASGLSFWAFTDRASALSVAGLEDNRFTELFSDESDLSGSPVRLEAIGDRALALDTPDAALAAAAFAGAVEKEPRDGALEAKYAFARYVEMGFLPPDAAAALSRSYYRMPYGTREFAAWRLDFMEAVWSFLPESLKAAALREARVYGPPRRLERLSQAAQVS